MSDHERPEIYQQIEQAQDFSDLLVVKAGIEKSSDLLLAEFEEKILDKVLELLSDQREHHFCSSAEFSFLIAGLDSKLSTKYRHALTLATNAGMSNFQAFNRTWEKFLQEHGEKLKSFGKNIDVSPLLKEPLTQSRINGVRGAINQQQFDSTGESSQKRKRTKTTEQSIPEIGQFPFKEIVDNLYQLSLAALQCRNGEKQLMTLEIFEDLSLDKTDDSYDLFDALKFAHLHHPDSEVRRRAQYVLETFTALGAYVAEDIRGRTNAFGEIEIVHLNPRKEVSQSQLQTNVRKSVVKGAILEETFDHPTTLSDDHLFEENIKSVGYNSISKMTQTGTALPAFHERPDSFIYDPLADEIIRFTMEQELTLLKKEGNFSGFVLPSGTASNQENILLTWRGNITRDDLKKLDSSTLLRLSVDLPNLLNLSNKPLEINDVAAILAFLRPELNLDETIPLTELKDQARGGMFPISKRGIRVNFDQSHNQDKLLAQIGLNRITFQRTTEPHHLQVSLQLGKRAFTFEVNEQMEAPTLAKLAPAEKAWIERVVFSYLLAVKNRDLYQTATISTKPITENQTSAISQTTEINQTENHARQEVSNSSHLYVLPFSHQPKDWEDPNSIVNLEVKEEFGYSLLELNLHFAMAQENLEYLDTIEDKTLRRIILSSLKRLEDKTNPENWKLSRVQSIKAQIKEIMLGEKTKSDSVNSMNKKETNDEDLENIALIGFKHEPTDPTGPPLQIKLSEVSSQLFAQIM